MYEIYQGMSNVNAVTRQDYFRPLPKLLSPISTSSRERTHAYKTIRFDPNQKKALREDYI